MSIKTIKQRIAVVAVAALTAGVISVVSTPVATAAAGVAIDRGDISATTTFTAGANRGICYTANSAADLTNTYEMVQSGIMALTIAGSPTISIPSPAGGANLKFAISGPGNWINYTANTGNIAVPSLSSDSKTLTYTATTTDVVAPSSVTWIPTGTGTVQITITNTRSVTDGTVTPVEILTVYVKAACSSGTYSYAYVKTTSTTSKSTAAANSIDDADYTYAGNEGSLYVRYDMFDSNDVALANTSASGLVSAEVSSGALVAATTATATSTLATATSKASYFVVTQQTVGVPWSGTLTLKLDGVTIATKSLKIHGAPKTIEVSGIDVRGQGLGSGQGGDYVMKDSAGNVVEVAYSAFVTLTDAQSKIITAGTSSRTPSNTTARQLAGTTKGQFDYACLVSGPGATATGLKLRYTDSALVTITSPEFSLTCGGDIYTYSASLDKASYVPGDIATLTITAKDAYGNTPRDADTLGVAGSVPAFSGSNLTVVTAPTYSDTFTAGKKTYTFTVGSTEGSYNLVVDLPEFNSTSKPQAAVTVPYKIAASTATVSNADVLKSIVALIASINKQIQALQKLILKR